MEKRAKMEEQRKNGQDVDEGRHMHNLYLRFLEAKKTSENTEEMNWRFDIKAKELPSIDTPDWKDHFSNDSMDEKVIRKLKLKGQRGKTIEQAYPLYKQQGNQPSGYGRLTSWDDFIKSETPYDIFLNRQFDCGFKFDCDEFLNLMKSEGLRQKLEDKVEDNSDELIIPEFENRQLLDCLNCFLDFDSVLKLQGMNIEVSTALGNAMALPNSHLIWSNF